MPPPPSSRKSPSPISPSTRSTPVAPPAPASSAASRPQVLVSRTLHFGPSTPANSPAAHTPNHNLHKTFEDHKENSTENVKRTPDRSNQSWKASPKRPCVTHFSKLTPPSASPKKKILSERNQSNSPVKAGSIQEGSEANIDKRPKVLQQEQQQQEAGGVEGVAELSKRIQRFLEDQEALLGVKNASPSGFEEEMSVSAPSSKDAAQRTFSSPYDPYHSPFFDRPKFLRLRGTALDAVENLNAGYDEELPLYDGAQTIITPTPPRIENAAIPLPKWTESVEEEGKEGDGEKGFLEIEETAEKAREDVVVLESSRANLEDQTSDGEDDNDSLDVGKEHDEASLGASKEVAGGPDVVAAGQDLVQEVAVAEDPKNGGHLSREADCEAANSSMEATDVEEVELDDVSWGARIAKNLVGAIFLAAFLALALLVSDSPGLLPPSLRNNHVSSLWRASKYHQPALALLHGMDGLWNTELTSVPFLPADIRLIKLRAHSFFQSVKERSDQVRSGLGFNFGRSVRDLTEWCNSLLDELFRDENSDTGETHREDSQFDWIHAYDFQEDWSYEDTMLAFPDWEWELLHEYDLDAANKFVLDAIPESSREDIQANFSLLSDSPKVKDVLSDLMKWGTGEPGYRSLRESASYFPEFQRSWMELGNETPVDNSEGTLDGLPSTLEDTVRSDDQPFAERTRLSEHHLETQTTQNEHMEKKDPLETSKDIAQVSTGDRTEESSLPSEDAQYNAAEFPSQEECFFNSPGSDLLENADSFPDMRPLDARELAKTETCADVRESETELLDQGVSHGEETVSIPMQRTLSVSKKYSSATIASTIVIAGFLLLLIRRMQSKDISKLTSSSVQFLRKDHPEWQESKVHELQQSRQPAVPVTMIEELNDKYASVLQSPEPHFSRLRSPVTREDEELIRSPLSGSVDSPYGSFTTYKLVPKKEGQTVESKLTPVRRSSRLRHNVSMSPNAVARIAISPP